MRFEWDPEKADENLKNHGVSFEDGIEVFDDPFELDRLDEHHSDDEIRFNMIGRTHKRVLFVAYTIPGDQTVRIISVRPATAREKREYYEE